MVHLFQQYVKLRIDTVQFGYRDVISLLQQHFKQGVSVVQNVVSHDCLTESFQAWQLRVAHAFFPSLLVTYRMQKVFGLDFNGWPIAARNLRGQPSRKPFEVKVIRQRFENGRGMKRARVVTAFLQRRIGTFEAPNGMFVLSRPKRNQCWLSRHVFCGTF